MVRYCGRRILCHPDFRLYLSTTIPKPSLSPRIASETVLVNYGVSNETLVDDLLQRSFARMQPQLFGERQLALSNFAECNETMTSMMEIMGNNLQKKIQAKSGPADVEQKGKEKANLIEEKEVEGISDLTSKRLQVQKNL